MSFVSDHELRILVKHTHPVGITPLEAQYLRKKPLYLIVSYNNEERRFENFSPSAKVEELKTRVNRRFSIHRQFHLTYRDRELRPERGLEHYNLVRGSHLRVQVGQTTLGAEKDLNLNYLNRFARGKLDGLQDDLGRWSLRVHPDGKPYYIIAKGIQGPFFITNDFISQNKALGDHLEAAGDKLLEDYKVQHKGASETLEIFVSAELGLEPQVPGDVQVIRYYFAQQEWKQVLWLDEPRHGHEDHLKHGDSIERLLVRNFLCHLETFPSHYYKPYHEFRDFLAGSLVYAMTEQMLYPNQAVSMFQEAKDILELWEHIPKDSLQFAEESGQAATWYGSAGAEVWFVAATLGQLLSPGRIRTYGSHSSPSYRNADHPMALQTRWEIFWDWVFDILSFGIFRNYKRHFRAIWQDEKVTTSEWRDLHGLVTADLSDFNLLATVLLSANVGVFALSAKAGTRTCSFMSTFFAVGSVVMGLHNSVVHRVAQVEFKNDDSYADNVFKAAAKFDPTLSTLALLYAFPPMLLVWSVEAFACAIALLAFGDKWPVTSYVLQGTSFAIVGTIVLVASVAFWQLEKYREKQAATEHDDDDETGHQEV